MGRTRWRPSSPSAATSRRLTQWSGPGASRYTTMVSRRRGRGGGRIELRVVPGRGHGGCAGAAQRGRGAAERDGGGGVRPGRHRPRPPAGRGGRAQGLLAQVRRLLPRRLVHQGDGGDPVHSALSRSPAIHMESCRYNQEVLIIATLRELIIYCLFLVVICIGTAPPASRLGCSGKGA